MSIKEISNLYTGKSFTILEHIKENTSIAQFLYSASEPTPMMVPTQVKNIYIEHSDPEIRKLIIGTAEFLAKILLYRRLHKDEKEIYQDTNIKRYASCFSSYINNLSKKETEALKNDMGEGRFRSLHNRLNHGYLESFVTKEEDQITRSSLLFKLVRFYNRKELHWFMYEIPKEQEEIVQLIWNMATRAANTWIEEFKPKHIDSFPEFGNRDELSATVDLRLDDNLFIFASAKEFRKHKETFKEHITIFNACRKLSNKNFNAYVYCIKTNELIKVF